MDTSHSHRSDDNQRKNLLKEKQNQKRVRSKRKCQIFVFKYFWLKCIGKYFFALINWFLITNWKCNVSFVLNPPVCNKEFVTSLSSIKSAFPPNCCVLAILLYYLLLFWSLKISPAWAVAAAAAIVLTWRCSAGDLTGRDRTQCQCQSVSHTVSTPHLTPHTSQLTHHTLLIITTPGKIIGSADEERAIRDVALFSLDTIHNPSLPWEICDLTLEHRNLRDYWSRLNLKY